MIVYSDLGVVWYAMKTTYKKELQAKEYLEARDIECFVPLKQEITTRCGRKRVVQKPIIHNLIFVKTDLAQLRELKIDLSYLHNIITDIDDQKAPIVVPSKQMEQFIAAITDTLSKIIYVDLATTQLEKGTPVRITDGKYRGYEGELEKIKGKRDRRVTIVVGGVIAYKIDVEACYIERI